MSDRCHFCNKEEYNMKYVSGLRVCVECEDGIQAIASAMNNKSPSATAVRGDVVARPNLSQGDWFTLLPAVPMNAFDELSVVIYTGLHGAVSEGWVPIALVYSDDIEVGNNRVHVGRDQYNSDIFNEINVFAVGRQPMFLMGRMSEDAKLHNRLKVQLEKVKAFGLEREEFEKKFKEYEKRIKEIEYEMKRAQEQAQESSGRTHEANQKCHKLEKHVGILRADVGEKRAKELLGEES